MSGDHAHKQHQVPLSSMFSILNHSRRTYLQIFAIKMLRDCSKLDKRKVKIARKRTMQWPNPKFMREYLLIVCVCVIDMYPTIFKCCINVCFRCSLGLKTTVSVFLQKRRAAAHITVKYSEMKQRCLLFRNSAVQSHLTPEIPHTEITSV